MLTELEEMNRQTHTFVDYSSHLEEILQWLQKAGLTLRGMQQVPTR